MARIFLGFTLVALLTCAPLASGLKILGISTLPSPSHHLWFTKFMNGLASRGHEIYALGVQPTKFDEANVAANRTKSIVFEGLVNYSDSETFDLWEWVRMSPMETAWILCLESDTLCETQMATKGAKQVLELVKNTKIDVIVQDITVTQCFYGLLEVAQGNPALVAYSPFGTPSWMKGVVGGNDWPAIKSFTTYPKAPPFNLWEKTLNFIYHEYDNILRQYYYMPRQQEIAEKFIGKKMSRPLDQIQKTISVLLLNSYPALDPGLFLPPNAINVGGLHVTDPKPLPKDIKEFLDGAEHGVVVISMGTNVKSSILGPSKLKAIVDALGQLKQRVLWKFETDHLPDKPNNVMIKKWLPQSDVLAHPKVRVLWSHSGLLSGQEAVWRGVPLVGMPFLLDQYVNIDLLIKKGVALSLDFESLTTETILKTLNRILTDPSFSRRMKELSEEFRDRPMSPLDLAVWHVEYAARHPRGSLSSPGKDLSRAQLNLLDVYALLGVALFSIFLIFWLLLRALLNVVNPQHKTKTD